MTSGSLINTASDNHLLPNRHQAIIWRNADLQSIETKRTKLSESTYLSKQMQMKMPSVKCPPICSVLHVLSFASMDP